MENRTGENEEKMEIEGPRSSAQPIQERRNHDSLERVRCRNLKALESHIKRVQKANRRSGSQALNVANLIVSHALSVARPPSLPPLPEIEIFIEEEDIIIPVDTPLARPRKMWLDDKPFRPLHTSTPIVTNRDKFVLPPRIPLRLDLTNDDGMEHRRSSVSSEEYMDTSPRKNSSETFVIQKK